MLLFWVLASLLIGVVFSLILPVLLHFSPATIMNNHQEKREVFRQQLHEIELDQQNGLLDATQFENAKNELKRQMTGVMECQGEIVLKDSTDKRLALLLVVLIPVMAFFLYFKLGNPASINTSTKGVPEVSQHHDMVGDMASLLDSLKSKLDKNPNNGEGWTLLARTYVELGRHSEAIPAYEKAMSLITDDAQLMVDYADALAVVNGHSLTGVPEKLVNQALLLEPNNTKALMLAATADFDRKDYQGAIEIWKKLQQNLPKDSDLLPDVNASIHEAYLQISKVSSLLTTESSVEPSNVSGIVTLSPNLVKELKPDATLFVFARAVKGPPMPLAIVRVPAKQLPYTFYLNDSNSIMPDHKLSQFKRVVLIARVSSSGNAKQKKGDLEGMSDEIDINNNKVEVEINKIIQ